MTDLLGLLELTGGPVIRVIKWVTLETGVVVTVRRTMRKAGYRVHSKQLRLAMYAPEFSHRLAAAPRDGDDLHHTLAPLIKPSNPDGIALLRDTLTEVFRRRQPGSTAASEFHEVASQSRHQENMTMLRQIHSLVGGGSETEAPVGDDAAFDYRLAELHPLRAEELRELRIEWPATTRLVAALATSADRAALLRRWASHPPTFLDDAPPAVLGVLSDIASDLHGTHDDDLALTFIEQGLELGLEPRGYWKLRLIDATQMMDVAVAAEALLDVRGYPLVEAALHPDGMDQAIELLEGWRAPTRREEVHRRLLLIEYYTRARRLSDAIALAQETATQYDSTAAALLAVRGLMARHMSEAAPAHAGDLSTALLLTVESRAKRRRWGLDSGAALAAEIRVRRALADHQGALDIANGVGEVPATPEELRHPDVIAESALIQAARGDLEVARRLVEDAEPARRAQIYATIAEREGRNDVAVVYWQEAIEATDDWGEKADLALQLALQGVRSPFVDLLIPDNPDVAQELTRIAALFGHQPGALEEFRGFARAEYRGTLLLFNYFIREEDADAAGAVAREGAARWNDADLWIESARQHVGAGRALEAITDVHAALAAAPDGWGGRRVAYRLLVEAHSASDDWQEALNAAAQLVARYPDDASASWALVVCQVRTNDLAGAMQTWQDAGSPEPDGQTQVAAWIELLQTFGPDVGSARDALKIAARYPTDEPIRRMLISALFMSRQPQDGDDQPDADGPSLMDPDEPDQPAPGSPEAIEREAFQELLADYFRDFPDGSIRQVPFDVENPLESMQAIMGEPASTGDLDQRIAEGGVPIGLAGEVYGRTYLETLLAREYGPVYTGTPDADAEEAAIAFAEATGVILDLSALVTIEKSPEALRAQLIGLFGNARVLTEQHRDAIAGARIVARDSGLSFRPGRTGEPGRFQRREPELLARARDLADRVEAAFARFTTDAHPAITAIDPISELDFDRPFLLAADDALASGLALWADDRALKEMVRGLGGRAFDTPGLLHHLREQGQIDAGLIDLAEATLVAAGYTGVRFHRRVWDLAVLLGAQPAGLINAIKFGGGENSMERARFALSMIDNHVAEPTVFSGFVHAFAQWLINAAPGGEEAVRNLELLSRDFLQRPWMNSSTLPYCIEALRATTGGVDAASVLLREIHARFEALVEHVDERTAALYVFELVSHLDPPDAYRVRAAVISHAFE